MAASTGTYPHLKVAVWDSEKEEMEQIIHCGILMLLEEFPHLAEKDDDETTPPQAEREVTSSKRSCRRKAPRKHKVTVSSQQGSTETACLPETSQQASTETACLTEPTEQA